MAYFAQVDETGEVQKVVVADSAEWLSTRLGGTWVETFGDAAEKFAGRGYYRSPTSQWKFAPEWKQPSGVVGSYPVGAVVYHNGQIWQSKLPANVWEPGVVGWRDPISEIPKWQQPVGAPDAYALNDEVFHNGKEWRSNVPANVWEPGAQGITQWDDITETPPSDEWQANTAYAVNDVVTYQGTSYSCIQAHTSLVGWEPPNVPALWAVQ